MSQNRLPSFFIIGMQKAGTSTLHSLLKQDKRIIFPYRKETHFFSTNFNKGIDWYLSQFQNSLYEIKGEVDPSYVFYPNALQNIKKYIPNPKFIIILRQPIERSYSHYLMSKARGYESLSFNQALLNENERLLNDNELFNFSNHSYIKRSRYYDLICKVKSEFKMSQILYLKFDDLKIFDHKKDMMKKIYKFLDLSFYHNFNYDIHENKSWTYRYKSINNIIYQKGLLRSFLKGIIPFENVRYKIINYINYLNSQEYIKDQDYLSNINDEFIKINNHECELLLNDINFDINDWII